MAPPKDLPTNTMHELHKDYPFCAENRIVPNTKNERQLLLTLYDKQNYVKQVKCYNVQ